MVYATGMRPDEIGKLVHDALKSVDHQALFGESDMSQYDST
jgi:hypothetical protein